jgi:hypothetical protein
MLVVERRPSSSALETSQAIGPLPPISTARSMSWFPGPSS